MRNLKTIDAEMSDEEYRFLEKMHEKMSRELTEIFSSKSGLIDESLLYRLGCHTYIIECMRRGDFTDVRDDGSATFPLYEYEIRNLCRELNYSTLHGLGLFPDDEGRLAYYAELLGVAVETVIDPDDWLTIDTPANFQNIEEAEENAFVESHAEKFVSFGFSEDDFAKVVNQAVNMAVRFHERCRVMKEDGFSDKPLFGLLSPFSEN